MNVPDFRECDVYACTQTHRNNYNIMWKVVEKDKVQCQFKEAEWYNNLEQCFSKYHHKDIRSLCQNVH